PALFTMTSRRPVSFTARSTSACTCATSRTSISTTTARPPLCSIAVLDASIASRVRPERWTWAPAAPSFSAIARPIPLEAPVTIAVFPARGFVVIACSSPVRIGKLTVCVWFVNMPAVMPRAARATPERILDAALVRFAQYGFRRTSMEDIAAEAGVSRAALYLQFDNKEAIFRALSEALHERALAAAIAALAGDE